MDIDFQNIDEPIKMSLEDFMNYYGVSSPVSDFLIDKLKGNRQIKTSNGMKKFENDAKNAREEYYKKRQDIIDEYYSLVMVEKLYLRCHWKKVYQQQEDILKMTVYRLPEECALNKE